MFSLRITEGYFCLYPAIPYYQTVYVRNHIEHSKIDQVGINAFVLVPSVGEN